MNSLTQFKNRLILPLLITLVLLCFGLLPTTQAVVPAPDGGYPNFTTAEGQNALKNLTTGAANTAVGWYSLFSNAEGSFNTATGAGALLFNQGSANTAVGAATLLNNTADENTATGAQALLSNTTGLENTANGVKALLGNTEGFGNTAAGYQALASNSIGTLNTAIGIDALINSQFGSSNIALGTGAGEGVTSADEVICIGAYGANVSNACYIGQIFGATSANGVAVFVDTNGRLGTMTSSKRFKQDIKPMDNLSEALYLLKPVTFRYKKGIDPQGIPQCGLVAEEVEKVNPDLVVRDKKGKPYSVRYDQVNAMLLNEFLKEHQTVQELKSAAAKQGDVIASQQKQIEALTEGLQKVSAQLEVSKPAPQTVKNAD